MLVACFFSSIRSISQLMGTFSHTARRPPESPFLVPAEDIGPPPSFDLAFLCGNIGKYLVPPTVLKGHSSASINRLEAHFDLRIVNSMSSIPVQKYKANTRLPHRDPAALEALASCFIVDLNPRS